MLGRLVAAAPDLRKLAIEFDAHEIICPIDFKYLVLDTHWPHLRQIKLDSVDALEDDCKYILDLPFPLMVLNQYTSHEATENKL